MREPADKRQTAHFWGTDIGSGFWFKILKVHDPESRDIFWWFYMAKGWCCCIYLAKYQQNNISLIRMVKGRAVTWPRVPHPSSKKPEGTSGFCPCRPYQCAAPVQMRFPVMEFWGKRWVFAQGWSTWMFLDRHLQNRIAWTISWHTELQITWNIGMFPK